MTATNANRSSLGLFGNRISTISNHRDEQRDVAQRIGHQLHPLTPTTRS
jgi:hypothetical protein